MGDKLVNPYLEGKRGSRLECNKVRARIHKKGDYNQCTSTIPMGVARSAGISNGTVLHFEYDNDRKLIIVKLEG